MMNMKKWLLFGVSTVDIYTCVDQLPQSDEEIDFKNTNTRYGGDGFLMANTFATFNMPYHLVSPCGSGIYGEQIQEEASRLGITLEPLHKEENGCTYSLIDQEGHVRKMMVMGAEMDFEDCEVVDADLETYEGCICSASTLLHNSSILWPYLMKFAGHLYLYVDTPDFFTEKEFYEAILSLQPVIFARDHILQAYQEKDLLHTIQELYAYTNKEIVLLFEDGRCASFLKEEPISLQETWSHVVDQSGYEECFFVSYILATSLGVSREDALVFAKDAASDILQSYDLTIPTSMVETKRQLLAQAIMKVE